MATTVEGGRPTTATTAREAAKPAEGTPYVHTMQSGDTLAKLAERFFGEASASTVQLLKDANDIKDVRKIPVGKQLMIPMTVIHYIERGETLTGLAKDFLGGANPAEIRALAKSLQVMNEIKDPTKLQIGQAIALPHT
jgi:LysM repeat protein